jgi:CheY-like chemotaxis protein
MSAEKRILAVMNDLFFAARIMDAAKKAGLRVEFVKEREQALEKAKAGPSLMLFDLNYTAADPVGLIRQIKSDPATNGIRTVAFVSHVQIELKRSAEDAGCDRVIARSAFAQNLGDILRGVG